MFINPANTVIGSDDPTLLDLNPTEKKEARAKKAKELQRQQAIQQQQLAEVRRQVREQGGQATPELLAAHKELEARDAALKQASRGLQESIARDEAPSVNGVVPNGLPVAGGGLPNSNGLTSSLPTRVD
jgi:hypothetical protein